MPTSRRKHVPLRSCIVCQEKRSKRELVRIVYTPEGTLEVDPKGKRPGRGAYVCRDPQCSQTGLEPRRLSRALKHQVTREQVAVLQAQVAALVAGDLLAGTEPLDPGVAPGS